MYKACSRKISPTKLPAELVYIKLGLNALLLSDLHVIQYIYIYYIIRLGLQGNYLSQL